MRLLIILSAGYILAGIIGCGPKPIPEPPRPLDDMPMDAVIARVNENSRRLTFMIKGSPCSARGEYVDSNGQRKSFQATALMLYRKPRDLYLKFEHLASTILEIGSNDRQWWYWQHGNEDWYYHGLHDASGSMILEDLPVPIRSDLLLEILGLSELPASTKTVQGPTGPLFWVGAEHYGLCYCAINKEGRLYGTKSISIDRYPPHLVRAIVFFHPDGHPLIKAELSDYQPITKGENILAPRQIEIRNLQDNGWLELQFQRIQQFDKPQAAKKYIEQSPLERGERPDHVIPISHETADKADDPSRSPAHPAETATE